MRTRLNADALYACVHVSSVFNGVGFFCRRCRRCRSCFVAGDRSNNSSPRSQELRRRRQEKQKNAFNATSAAAYGCRNMNATVYNYHSRDSTQVYMGDKS